MLKNIASRLSRYPHGTHLATPLRPFSSHASATSTAARSLIAAAPIPCTKPRSLKTTFLRSPNLNLSRSMSSSTSTSTVDVPVTGHSNCTLHAINGGDSTDSSKPALLLLHGGDRNFQNSSHWTQHYDFLASVGSFYSIDLPGHGSSKPPPSDSSFPNMDHNIHSSAVLSLIQSELKDNKNVVLVGRSYGAKVVQSTLEKLKSSNQLDQIKAVVLIAPAIQPGDFNSAVFADLPILLVWAEDDPIVQFSRYSEIQSKLPSSHQLLKYQNVVSEQVKAENKSWLGHLPENSSPENAEKFQQTLKSFLQNKCKF